MEVNFYGGELRESPQLPPPRKAGGVLVVGVDGRRGRCRRWWGAVVGVVVAMSAACTAGCMHSVHPHAEQAGA